MVTEHLPEMSTAEDVLEDVFGDRFDKHNQHIEEIALSAKSIAESAKEQVEEVKIIATSAVDVADASSETVDKLEEHLSQHITESIDSDNQRRIDHWLTIVAIIVSIINVIVTIVINVPK